jgi:PAS domain S-box-containing protein
MKNSGSELPAIVGLPTQDSAERILRGIVDLTPDAIFLHGLDGKFLYVNYAACTLLGYSRDELHAMYPWDFVVNDSRDDILGLWQALAPGVPVMVEGLFRRKDGGTLPAEVRLARFGEADKVWIAAFCRDISARRKSDDALRSEERTRMARDIHDTLAHGLTAIAVQLEAARHIIGDKPDEVAVHVGNALQLARESLREARRSVRALGPEALESGDLAEALQQLVGCRSVSRPEKFHFRLHGRPRPLPNDTEAHLLRIGQEALTNVLKHARAANVVMELDYTDCEVRLHVEDDGRGFDPEAGQGEGVGLTGMNERAEQMGVRLVIQSSQGNGTSVTVAVPVPPDPEGKPDGR